MSPPAALPVEDLWDWLGREMPFSPILPRCSRRRRERDFCPRPLRLGPIPGPHGVESPESPPPGQLELLLVDSTFGTEELASYAKSIQQVEEPPLLSQASWRRG